MDPRLERFKIRANRWLRRQAARPVLRRMDERPLPARKANDVWLFTIVRNEALRLPYVLRYHFDLGVSRVVALDNASTDGTRDVLRSDPRIHWLSTGQSFRKNKAAWLDLLLRRYGRGHWNLVLDADELFVYPQMDRLALPDLAAALEAEGAAALHCLFLEMFSREPIGQTGYRAGDDLRAVAPWFDAEGYEPKKYRPVFGGAAPDFVYMGGTRRRMFPEEFGCSKYPFFRYDPAQFLRLGLHTIEGAKISRGQGAVLHFKYLRDFRDKAFREAERGVYWNASAEYKAYAERFRKEGDFTLWHPGAKRYEGWRQLAELGLVKDLPAASGPG